MVMVMTTQPDKPLILQLLDIEDTSTFTEFCGLGIDADNKTYEVSIYTANKPSRHKAKIYWAKRKIAWSNSTLILSLRPVWELNNDDVFYPTGEYVMMLLKITYKHKRHNYQGKLNIRNIKKKINNVRPRILFNNIDPLGVNNKWFAFECLNTEKCFSYRLEDGYIKKWDLTEAG